MRSFDRTKQSSRMRRERDEGIHIRKNGEMYLLYTDKVARCEKNQRAVK